VSDILALRLVQGLKDESGATMKFNRRTIFALIPLSFIFASSLQAAPNSTWNGTWTGSWGGSYRTSITIAEDRVVSYVYLGMSIPVARSIVTPEKITYAGVGATVTLTRTGNTTALANLHCSRGDATAVLTKH